MTSHAETMPGAYKWRSNIESGKHQLGELIGPDLAHYC